MPNRLAPFVSDLACYLMAGVSGAFAAGNAVVAQVGPDPVTAVNGGTIAAVILAILSGSTPLILRAVDIVRAKEAIRQYRHYAKNLEQRLDLKDGENRMLRDCLVRMSRKHDFDLPDWFYDDPEPGPPRGGPVLPPVVTPDPDADPNPLRDRQRGTPRREP
jgi:hypothetical protein